MIELIAATISAHSGLTMDESRATLGFGPIVDRIRALPKHKRRVADFFLRHHRDSWTAKQVANYLSLTVGTVQKHVEALVAEGLIHEEDDEL